MNYIEELAKKGRHGDTEMRPVDGKLSHVNPTEAEIIDRYGPIGQLIVKDIGSGTVNPHTGHNEYFLKKAGKWLKKNAGALMGAGIGLATGGIGSVALGLMGGGFAQDLSDGKSFSLNTLRKGKAGKFWDTHFGRKGLIGEGGEMLGLWESGTTVDKKNRAIDAVQNMQNRIKGRAEDTSALMDDQLKTDLLLQNAKMNNMNVGQSTGLATDNSRANYINQAIQNNIRQKNQILASNNIAQNKHQDTTEIALANLDDKADSIRNS